MAGKHTLGGTRERAFAGCTITFIHDDGRELVRHYGGYAHETNRFYEPRKLTLYGIDAILTDVCKQLDLCGNTWKIKTISNPQTIYQDIKGRPRHGVHQQAHLPEPQILGRLGLTHHYAGALGQSRQAILARAKAAKRHHDLTND